MKREKDDNSKTHDMSRRKFIIMSASSSIAAGLTVPIISNAFVDDGLRRNCWNTIRNDKTRPEGLGPIVVPETVDEALPKLKIWQIRTPLTKTPVMNHCSTYNFIVENKGMTVATSVFVELLEADRMALSFEEMASNPVQLKSECFRRNIWGPGVLYPGCFKQVNLEFKREFSQGQCICICYDSIKDPKKFPDGVGIGAPKNRKLVGSGAFSPDDPHNIYYTDSNEGTHRECLLAVGQERI